MPAGVSEQLDLQLVERFRDLKRQIASDRKLLDEYTAVVATNIKSQPTSTFREVKQQKLISSSARVVATLLKSLVSVAASLYKISHRRSLFTDWCEEIVRPLTKQLDLSDGEIAVFFTAVIASFASLQSVQAKPTAERSTLCDSWHRYLRAAQNVCRVMCSRLRLSEANSSG